MPLLGFTALALAALVTAADARFEEKQLTVDGDVFTVVAADLDGDAHKDLLVLYAKGVAPRETRHLAVFWNRSGRFYERPDELLDFGADACAFDVADVDAHPGEELIWIAPNGVFARSFTERKIGAPVALISAPTVFPLADKAQLPRLRLVQDVSQDGSRELLVPAPSALDVYRRAEQGYARAAHLAVKLDSEIHAGDRSRTERAGKSLASVSVTLRFPAVYATDTDGDGLRELVLALEDRVAVYRQGAGMVFRERPSFERDFSLRTAEDRKESYSSAGISVADLDGDGITDLVVRKQVAHGIASASATNQLFLGRKGGGYASRPDQTLTNEGAGGSEVELFDITGDGHPDLIVPSVSLGVFAVIRFLTSKTLEVNVQVFAFNAARRRFAEEPTAERELKFDLSLGGEADSQAFDMLGDYDGDRRPDLAFATGEDELSIFPGVQGGSLFAEDAAETIKVRSFGELYSVDLDQRGRSDMVLFYPKTRGHRSEVIVLRNR